MVLADDKGGVMKIGVLGGTFDPIHNGHIAIAEESRRSLGLDEVRFVPSGQPYLRTNGPVLAAGHRLEMVRRALTGRVGFKVSSIEIERPGPSYTVDTLAALRTGLDSGDELYFIMGWDKLPELPEWKEPARLLDLCFLVAVPRPGSDPPDLEALESLLPEISRRVRILDAPRLDISASLIRERIKHGRSIRDLVPGAVADYIREEGLYRPSD